MGDSQFYSPSWLSPGFDAPYQQDATTNSILLSAHGFDFPNANLGLFPPADPTGFQTQAPNQDRAHQTHNVDSKIDREIVELLRCATPTTKESIRHLLRRSARASRDTGSPSRQTSNGPAVEESFEPPAQNSTYHASNGDHSRAQGDDYPMVSPSADPSFDLGHEHYEYASTQRSESMEWLSNRPRHNTLPTPSNEHVLLARQMATKPYFSTPGPSQPSPTIRKSNKTLGGGSMTSQSRFYGCECGVNCSTKGDLDRHQKGPCDLTKDKIHFTCLLDVWAPTCDRPCSVESHQNACSPACQHRPDHDESRETLYRKYRADKMRIHLQNCHGWGNFSQGDIPKSWLWPVKRSLPADGCPRRVWVCQLCNEHLGTWEKDKNRINQHCQDCPKGTDARAVRFPRRNGQKLGVLLTKGIMGPSTRDDDIESGEYSPTSKLW